MATMTEQHRIAREAGDALGVRFTVENTGGGCEVLSATLEGGLVVVLGDGNLAADFDYNGAYLQVAVYTYDAWHNGGDALADAACMDLQNVAEYVTVAVRAAMVTLRDAR